jgi:hypothetical protein
VVIPASTDEGHGRPRDLPRPLAALAALGFLTVLAAAGEAASIPSPPSGIVVEGGRLSARLDSVPMGEVLRSLGHALGAEVRITGAAMGGTVSARLEGVEVEAGVRRLLAGQSYVLGYREDATAVDGRRLRRVELIVLAGSHTEIGLGEARHGVAEAAAPSLEALAHTARWGATPAERAQALDATLYAAATVEGRDPHAMDVATAGLDDPDETVREQALATLKDSGEEVPVNRLARIADDDWSAARRIQALELLAERGEETIVAHLLRRALTDPDPAVGERAHELLADLHITAMPLPKRRGQAQ